MPNTPAFADLWRCYWAAWEVCALCAIEMPAAACREVTNMADNRSTL